MWENDLLISLLGELGVWTRLECEDMWWWKPEENGVFTVCSTYKLLADSLLPPGALSRTKEVAFRLVWKSLAPSKVVAFSWQLLRDRIPTKDNLVKRRVLPAENSENCSLCEQMVETSSHLFLHCQVAFEVWSKIMCWLEINFTTPFSLFEHFECWSGEIGNTKLRKGYWLVWHASISVFGKSGMIGFLIILSMIRS